MTSEKWHHAKDGPLIAITYPIDAYRVSRCLLYYPAIGNQVAELGGIGKLPADVAVGDIVKSVDYKVVSDGQDRGAMGRLMAKQLAAAHSKPVPGYSEIYQLASTARSKLETEANGVEHNLRLLVGHANLLDDLMDQLYFRKELMNQLYTRLEQPKSSERWSGLLEDLGSESDEDASDDESDEESLDDEYDGETVAKTSSLANVLEQDGSRPSRDVEQLEAPSLGSSTGPVNIDVASAVTGMAHLASMVAIQVEEVMAEEAKVSSALPVMEDEVPNADLLNEYGAGEDLGLTQVASRMNVTAGAAA